MRSPDGTGQRGHYPPKHVWVRVGEPPDEVAAPGIVLEWRAIEGCWEAWVVWADERASAHMEWLPEERVRPRE